MIKRQATKVRFLCIGHCIKCKWFAQTPGRINCWLHPVKTKGKTITITIKKEPLTKDGER